MFTQEDYQVYINEFDPTPYYYGDSYSEPLSYEDWVYELMDEIGLY